MAVKPRLSLYEWCIENNRNDILEEWYEEWNNKLGITLHNTTHGAHKKAYFKCKNCGEISLCNITDRTIKGSRCGKCTMGNQTSYPEQLILNLLRHILGEENVLSRHRIDGLEFDVVIPKLSLCIEYNSYRTHRDLRIAHFKEQEKTAICKNNNMRFIQICDYLTEEDEVLYNRYRDEYRYKESSNKLKRLSFIVKHILEGYEIVFNIDSKDLQMISVKAKEKCVNGEAVRVSLQDKVPNIILDWDYNKNGSITPDKVSYGSAVKYWFKCNTCGYEYQTSPKHKCRGTGCKKYHDTRTRKNSPLLKDLYPELAKEYSDENKRLLNEITYGYKQTCIWKCNKCDHEFKTSVNSRTYNKTGCPNCGYNWYKEHIGIEQKAIKKGDKIKWQ